MREKISVIRNADELKTWTRQQKLAGKTIGLVPTMGYLHAGQRSLIEAAVKACDVVVVSDFVNPTQFGPSEDYATYPRDEAKDLALCDEAGATVLFVPTVETLYPNGQDSAWVEVNHLGDHFCGAQRPGHFRGVTTVVMKLLLLSHADKAFFGEKDYQQLTIIRRMVSDFGVDCEIVGCPLVRESDGLALSSRNVNLKGNARKDALVLYRGLLAAKALFASGERRSEALIEAAKNVIESVAEASIQYIEVADPDTLDIFKDKTGERVQMLMAVRVGGVRLIDNMRL